MATLLILSPAAKDDLHGIFRFGSDRWGEEKAEEYLDMFARRLHRLVDSPYSGVARSEILPGVRSIRAERHVIFYRIERERIEVIRILGDRQDISVLLPR